MTRTRLRSLIARLALVAPILLGPSIRATSAADAPGTPSCPSKNVTPSSNDNPDAGDLPVTGSTERVVWSHLRWNSLGIRVITGQSYQFTSDKNQIWCDATIPSSPAGYTSDHARTERKASRLAFNSATESLRRLSSANWFALTCGIDDNAATYFVVGTGTLWRSPANGILGCFANDIGNKLIRDFYQNNTGFIALTVKRTE